MKSCQITQIPSERGLTENQSSSLKVKNFGFFRYALIFSIVLGSFLFLGLAAKTEAASFTATSTGNWNDGATWGNTSPGVEGTDYPSTAGGDTVTINGQKTVTIPVGHNARAAVSALNAGVTGTHTKLIINGSLRLEGATTTLNNYSELNLGAGATLDLDNQTISQANAAYVWYSWQGTSGSHAIVKSTTAGGKFAMISTGYTDIDWDYVDFSGLGDSKFGERTSSAMNCIIDHITVTNSGDFQFYTGGINDASNFSITNSDFRSPTGTNKYFLYVYLSGTTPTGTRLIQNNTFDGAGTNAQVRIIAAKMTVDNSIFDETDIMMAGCATNQCTVSNSFFHSAKTSVSCQTIMGSGAAVNIEVSNDYFYSDCVNTHTLVSNIGSVTGNVFESTDVQTDEINQTTGTLTVQNNIKLGTGSFFSTASGVFTTALTIQNNTMYPANDAGATMCYIENVTLSDGTINIASNLAVDSDTTSNNRGIKLYTNTADQVDYTDYNAFYGYPGGDVYDHYYNVAITGKTEGDAGFGGNDKVADPNFVDKTRTFATWDTSLGGAGTAANTIAEILKLNSYGGTFNSNYSVANLLTYIRAGFTPRNAALRGTGLGGADIGAVAVSNTAPSAAFGSFSSWNKGSLTINYTLTDADNDTCNISQTSSSGIEYSTDGSTWQDATKGSGGDGLTGLTCSSSGTSHTFVWNTDTDLPNTEDSTVYLRIAPSDGGGGLSWTASSAFGIDNVAPSSVGAPTFGTITASSITVVKPSSVTENGSGLYQWQARRNGTTELGFIATTTTSVTDSSLSPNTQYTYDVQFSDYKYSTSTYGTTAAKYTLADTPTNLAGTAGQTTMDLSVDSFTNPTAGLSGYYFSRFGANSSWIQTNSWADTGLTCGTSYTYTVEYKNGNGTETNTASLTKSTSACSTTGGGGGMPPEWNNPPKPPAGGFGVSINNGAEYTATSTVTLSLKGGSDTARMAISNFSGFRDAGQENYTTTKTWNLCQGLTSCPEGKYTVYVKFYAPWGTNSGIVSDTIIYKTTTLEKNLKYGQISDDVRQLQIFLNSNPDTQLTKSGPGSPGKETNFFGILTRAAVIKFQEKYTKDILAPWNLTKGTGFVGKTTRAKINEMIRQ